jgi:hypothetical protein
MLRHGKKITFEFPTVKGAARAACSDVEHNEAAPFSIEGDGVLVWQNDGPFTGSYDKLRELAEVADED